VFVLPSITTLNYKETWGLVVNEAMNQGVPVVVTDAVGAGVGGLVQDGINGFVVPERDAAALAYAIGRLLDDESLRASMGAAAQQTIAAWDNERMVRGFRAAIEYACHVRGVPYEETR
jgi:glycosyltransferase involved in cell wall biosynthesis